MHNQQQQHQFASSESPPLHSVRPSRSRSCSVCSGPSNGFYFGVLSCRACASFFRRSALERRKYLCRKANNCAIQTDGMRNSCRACRLSRCVEAGMCMESQGPTEGKLDSSTPENAAGLSSRQSSPSGSDQQSKLCLNMSFDISTPAVHQLAHSLRNMQNGYRALVSVIGHRSTGFSGRNELTLITLDEHLQTQRGEVTLLLALMREHFPGLDNLPNETRIRILKCFAFKLNFMNRAEMTIQAFPCPGASLSKLVLHPGCLMDRDQLDFFFCTEQGRPIRGNTLKNHRAQCATMLERMSKMVEERYRPLAISPMEFAALLGVQLWNSVERYVPLGAELTQKRDQLFAELHTLLARRLGSDPAAIGVRYGQLMGFVQEIAALDWELNEVLTVLKLFMPLKGDDLWEDLMSGRQDLDLVEQKANLEKALISLCKEGEEQQQAH